MPPTVVHSTSASTVMFDRFHTATTVRPPERGPAHVCTPYGSHRLQLLRQERHMYAGFSSHCPFPAHYVVVQAQ